MAQQLNRCVGVRVMAEGRESDRRGRSVVLSAGAIHSPALLLRAGIGPAAELKRAGVDVRADVPGVGKRLMDHPAVAITSFIRPHARINGRTRRHLFLGMRLSSGLAGVPASDMAVSFSSKSAWHAVGDQLSTANIWVNKTYSDQGEVRVASGDWRTMPQVDFNLLADARDVQRLMLAFRTVAALVLAPEMEDVIADPFPASYSDKVRQVAAITPKNRMLTAALARLLNGPDALRRRLIETFILEGHSLAALLADDDLLEGFIRHAAVGVWHASCSCRMGADDDPMAVLDPGGRVRGVGGLRVCDASAFPNIPRTNTCLPTVMLAERMADLIIEDGRSTPSR